MKTLFTLLLAVVCLSANAQDTSKFRLKLTDGYLIYQDVVVLDSTYSKELLYKSAKTWFVNNFKSAKAVIQSEDQSNGRFLGKAVVYVPAGFLLCGSVGPEIYFNIQIDIKNGKYRYRFYNFTYACDGLEKSFEPGYNLYLEDKTPRGIVISRNNLNKRLTEAYMSMQMQLNSLIANLYLSMKNSKQDEF